MRLNPDQKRRIRRISLTPLIDVVFLLLIFFMLSSSFLKFINIPVGGAGKANAVNPTREEIILIRIATEGNILVQGEDVVLEELTSRLDQLNETGLKKAAIQPMDGIKAQRVIEVLHQAKKSKLDSILLSYQNSDDASGDKK